ncbi:protein translocase SEC61 complex subunit gamma [Candidatus Bathyarchaeota archaeon]|nr:MAG: protein translocase SEC61 complex subunit gamma [Candidatus Bathyarchaeota archaeon]
MGLTDFLRSSARLLRRAKKPSWKELWTLIKISALGITLVGAIGFLTRLLSYLLQG